MLPDIEIAQVVKLQRNFRVALEKLGIAEEHLKPYGHYKAKISLTCLETLKGEKNAGLDVRNLVLKGDSIRNHRHARGGQLRAGRLPSVCLLTNRAKS